MKNNVKIPINNLVEVIRRLREPDVGCPWDIEQDFSSIAPYTIEEAYEVAHAIAENDMSELKSELGDLLFQVAFHARLAEEEKLFDFTDVVDAICEKMIRRHPHVFADATVGNSEEQTIAWERIKKDERKDSNHGLMDGVKDGLPALRQATKAQRKAAMVGFDWPSYKEVFPVIEREMNELTEAIDEGKEKNIEHELGDVLFSCVNLSRHLGIDPDMALRRANIRFINRFELMEQDARHERAQLQDLNSQQLEVLWKKAKEREGRKRD